MVKPSSPAASLDQKRPWLTIGTTMVLWIVLTTIVPLAYLYYAQPQRLPCLSACLLLFFNNLNILIAFCEIALGNQIAFIQADYQRLHKTYGGTGREYQAALQYLMHPLPLRQLANGKLWSKMWSTYSLWDPSYSNPQSFGFFIDVGNGWSTIVPCLMWNLALLAPQTFVSSSRDEDDDVFWMVLLGMMGAMSYWQILYGTMIYWLSFLWNRRYQDKPPLEILAFVGLTNGIWFIFPLLALRMCWELLMHRDLMAVVYGISSST